MCWQYIYELAGRRQCEVWVTDDKRLDEFIPPPSSGDLIIWRYMDFTKFIAMLENRALFFSRVSHLDDPFEGSFPRHQSPISRIIEMLPKGAVPPGAKLHVSPGLEDTWRCMRYWAMVNCWHASEHESAGMWKLYAASDLAVALRSTVDRLRGALGTPPPVREGFFGTDRFHIGMIEYIDFDTGRIPPGSFASQFFRKHRSFEHERELRAMVLEYPLSEAGEFDWLRQPDDSGASFPVNLDTLIEAVFIAPQAPKWYVELVSKAARRYGLAVEPQHSELGATPLY